MLQIRDIEKRFGGLIAVGGVTMDVPEGKITALIGPNGAGKTTLFSVISGFQEPTAGTIAFEGRDITGMDAHDICRLGIARTFQVVQPFAGLSVRENIAVGAHLRVRDRGEALRLAAEIAEQVGLADRLDMQAASLTVAGRKRLELARALATKPKLLLLDEVMAGLNPTEIAQIVPVIHAIRDAGITVLLIEHVMQAVMSLSDYVWVLANGRLIAEGEPKVVTSDPAVVEAYLGHGAAERIKRGTAHA